MKKIIFSLIALGFLSAHAEEKPSVVGLEYPIFVRTLFNSLNSSTHTCTISKNGAKVYAEIAEDGVKLGKIETKFSAAQSNVNTWREKLNSTIATNGKKALARNVTDKYVIRGTKRYSVVDIQGNQTVFYRLEPNVKRGGKPGSISHQYINDGGNTQRLRGEIDVACKNAHKAIKL